MQQLMKYKTFPKKLSIHIPLYFIIVFLPFLAFSDAPTERPHGDKDKLPRGCASCHVGHGKFNTALLPEKKETFCFRCHGNDEHKNKTKQQGSLARHIDPIDIQKEFEKPYHHPVGEPGIHKTGEVLPERDPSIPRHSECLDCHHPHLVTNVNKMSGLKGTNVFRTKNPIRNEYELCFNCHSYSANLPAYQTNKAELFNTVNPSFHPVMGQGKNSTLPSLQPPLTASSKIKCTDCHGSDDYTSPKGPHGSNFEHILSKHYSTTDGSEEASQYELCYSCHRRSSILNNESFAYHAIHISDVGVSCRTCHNPHGSTLNKHLIDFKTTFTLGASTSGRLDYASFGSKSGQCYLNCHDKDHNPEVYPKGSSQPAKQPSSSKKKK